MMRGRLCTKKERNTQIGIDPLRKRCRVTKPLKETTRKIGETSRIEVISRE